MNKFLLPSLIAAGLLVAASLEAEPLKHRWQSALQSGSPRLSFYSVMREKPSGAGKFVESFIKNDGLRHRGAGPELLFKKLSVDPMVSYDTNINNGLPGEEFYGFTIDPDDVAKEGFLVGAAISGSAGFSVGEGQVLTVSGMAAYQEAIDFDLNRKEVRLETCLNNHVAKWTWLDVCAGGRHVEKTTSVTEYHLSANASLIFSSGFADHEVKVGVKHLFADDYEKDYLTLGLVNAVPELGAIGVNLSLGEKVHGKHTATFTAGVSLTRPVFDRKTTFSLSYLEEGGSDVFGDPREDQTTMLKVTHAVSDNLTVGLGYKNTNSSVDFYDGGEVVFDVSLTGWSF